MSLDPHVSISQQGVCDTCAAMLQSLHYVALHYVPKNWFWFDSIPPPYFPLKHLPYVLNDKIDTCLSYVRHAHTCQQEAQQQEKRSYLSSKVQILHQLIKPSHFAHDAPLKLVCHCADIPKGSALHEMLQYTTCLWQKTWRQPLELRTCLSDKLVTEGCVQLVSTEDRQVPPQRHSSSAVTCNSSAVTQHIWYHKCPFNVCLCI